jgi:hypothetical protein
MVLRGRTCLPLARRGGQAGNLLSACCSICAPDPPYNVPRHFMTTPEIRPLTGIRNSEPACGRQPRRGPSLKSLPFSVGDRCPTHRTCAWVFNLRPLCLCGKSALHSRFRTSRRSSSRTIHAQPLNFLRLLHFQKTVQLCGPALTPLTIRTSAGKLIPPPAQYSPRDSSP